MLHTLPVLQSNHQWHNSDTPLVSIKVTAHICISVTTELLHSQLPMQVYALEQQSVATILLHSWAATVNTIGQNIDQPRSTVVTASQKFGLVVYFYQLDRKLVRTSPMFHRAMH